MGSTLVSEVFRILPSYITTCVFLYPLCDMESSPLHYATLAEIFWNQRPSMGKRSSISLPPQERPKGRLKNRKMPSMLAQIVVEGRCGAIRRPADNARKLGRKVIHCCCHIVQSISIVFALPYHAIPPLLRYYFDKLHAFTAIPHTRCTTWFVPL